MDSLALIVESGKAKTADDLLRYATQGGLKEGLPLLRELVDERIPVGLALDALRVHVRIVAFKRGSGLIAACEGKRVGLVLPLPPHVTAAFSHLAELRYLVPDGHEVPPHLEGVEGSVVHGTREARHVAATLDVLVFEAVKFSGGYAADGAVADLVDVRVLPAATRLVVHVRSQRHPDDVPFSLGERGLDVL